MAEELEKTGDNRPLRDEKGRLLPGSTANPDGRPVESAEKKLLKKALNEMVEEYREKLAESLPLLSPVLIAKALEGDIPAIKELNDRVMGKPQQDITSGGEKLPTPLLHVLHNNSSNEDSETPKAN